MAAKRKTIKKKQKPRKRQVIAPPSNAPKYNTTEAARAEMPSNVRVLIWLRDNAKSEIARIKSIEALERLARLDAIPEEFDDSAQVEIVDEPGKIIPLDPANAHAPSNAATG
jgi:YbbR domain-containing protein